MQSAYHYDSKAKRAGIMIMPGSGFGVVPTDIAANIVKDSVPDAISLTIAYATEGGASRGTLKTVLNSINKTGFRQRNSKLESAKPAESQLSFTISGKSFNAVYNPWRADLFTAELSTGIPNIETYTVFPPFVVSMMQGKLLWLRDIIVKHLLRFFPEGPSDKQLEKGATYIFAVTKNEKAETREITVKGPEAYLFTVYCLTEISKEILAGNHRSGFQTPSYFGRALLDRIEKVEIK